MIQRQESVPPAKACEALVSVLTLSVDKPLSRTIPWRFPAHTHQTRSSNRIAPLQGLLSEVGVVCGGTNDLGWIASDHDVRRKRFGDDSASANDDSITQRHAWQNDGIGSDQCVPTDPYWMCWQPRIMQVGRIMIGADNSDARPEQHIILQDDAVHGLDVAPSADRKARADMATHDNVLREHHARGVVYGPFASTIHTQDALEEEVGNADTRIGDEPPVMDTGGQSGGSSERAQQAK